MPSQGPGRALVSRAVESRRQVNTAGRRDGRVTPA